MENCIRCNVSSEDVRLFDAIYEGRMAIICERCSIIENIPIIKKPNSESLKESESPVGVFDRMKVIAGMRKPVREETFFQEDRLNELNNHPELELPEKEQLNLIDNFHWELMKNRRRKGLTYEQLAEILGESEMVIQMMEKGKLPESPERIIKKLEQFFQTRLKKISERERIIKTREKFEEPVLLDDEGNILDTIPEEEPYIPEIEKDDLDDEVECKMELFDVEKRKTVSSPVAKPYIDEKKDVDLKKINPQDVTISQLREIHKKKAEATRQEQIEEQMKIEERQRILQALREKDRLKQEQKKQEHIIKINKEEQNRQKLIEERRRETEEKRKKQFQEIDRYLGGAELLNRRISDSIEGKRDVKEFDEKLR